MSLKYYGRKVYDKRNGQICRPQKCRVKFGKTIFRCGKNDFQTSCYFLTDVGYFPTDIILFDRDIARGPRNIIDGSE